MMIINMVVVGYKWRGSRGQTEAIEEEMNSTKGKTCRQMSIIGAHKLRS